MGAHQFKIFDESDVAFDATSYNSPAIKLFDQDGNAVVSSVTGTWTAQNQGTCTFAFTQENRLTAIGPHYIEVELEKPDTIISTERRRITVVASP